MGMRKIIRIDEDLCDGCGLCVPSCAEGAIQIIDGKARLVGERLCDGLGACLGECPQGALTIEEREADEFDDAAVAAHREPPAREPTPEPAHDLGGCPSARLMQLRAGPRAPAGPAPASAQHASALEHWPVKLRLVPPSAPFLRDADLVLAADCVPFAMGDFHAAVLPDHAVVIGCPKFDDYADGLERLTGILRHGGVRSLTVVRMEVPCCGGYWRMALEAVEASGRSIPLRQVVIGVRGEVKPPRQESGGIRPRGRAEHGAGPA